MAVNENDALSSDVVGQEKKHVEECSALATYFEKLSTSTLPKLLDAKSMRDPEHGFLLSEVERKFVLEKAADPEVLKISRKEASGKQGLTLSCLYDNHRQSYTVYRTYLGEGTTGKSKLAQNNLTGQFATVKTFYDKDTPKGQKSDKTLILRKRFERERYTLQKLDLLYGFLERCDEGVQPKLYIFKRHEIGEELFKKLERCQNKKDVLTKKVFIAICRSAALALKEIHNKDAVHLDVKPENCIINDNNGITMVDFDRLTFLQDKGNFPSIDDLGSEWYQATELKRCSACIEHIKKHQLFVPTKALDMYSLGMLFYVASNVVSDNNFVTNICSVILFLHQTRRDLVTQAQSEDCDQDALKFGTSTCKSLALFEEQYTQSRKKFFDWKAKGKLSEMDSKIICLIMAMTHYDPAKRLTIEKVIYHLEEIAKLLETENEVQIKEERGQSPALMLN